jgi:aspartate/methionine/tyrosine aminotransferase
MDKTILSPSISREPNDRLADRISFLGLEGAFQVLAKAKQLEKQGKEIIHLEIGEPDFKTPNNITKAAIQSLNSGETYYTPSSGFPELKEQIAYYISHTRNAEVSSQEVFVTPGAKMMIFFAIMALVEKGEEVILSDPAYPTYHSLIQLVEGTPVFLTLDENKNFTFDIKELERKITHKTRMLILNSPQNPTGSVLSSEDLERIAFLSKKYDFWVLSDEIYSRIVYDTPYTSYYSIHPPKNRTILIDGFSKTYAMTGWRLGYGIMPNALIEAVTKLANNTHACTCTFVQKAGIEALAGPQEEVEKMTAEFKKRRDCIVQGLNEIPGFHCQNPGGAFYVFPNIQKTGMTSGKLADFLLEKAGVACLSGKAFGAGGEGFLRFSYANSIEKIQKALAQIKNVL